MGSSGLLGVPDKALNCEDPKVPSGFGFRVSAVVAGSSDGQGPCDEGYDKDILSHRAALKGSIRGFGGLGLRKSVGV